VGIRLSEGYDVRLPIRQQRAVAQCNVEQQAVLAELIGAACDASDSNELSPETFINTCGFHLNEDEFSVVRQARAWFMNSGNDNSLAKRK